MERKEQGEVFVTELGDGMGLMQGEQLGKSVERSLPTEVSDGMGPTQRVTRASYILRLSTRCSEVYEYNSSTRIGYWQRRL